MPDTEEVRVTHKTQQGRMWEEMRALGVQGLTLDTTGWTLAIIPNGIGAEEGSKYWRTCPLCARWHPLVAVYGRTCTEVSGLVEGVG